MIDEGIRYLLVSLAVEDYPRLRASDFEFHLPRPSYTYNTLRELTKVYPDDTFSLIIGEDNWQKFSAWRNSEEILAHYPLIVYPREGTAAPSSPVRHFPSVVHLPSAPLYPVSSTVIREAIAAGQDVSEWLDPSVYDKIRELGIYGTEGFLTKA